MATKAEKKAIKDQAQLILKIGNMDYDEELHGFHLRIIDENQEIVMKSLQKEADRVDQTTHVAASTMNQPAQVRSGNEGGNNNGKN